MYIAELMLNKRTCMYICIHFNYYTSRARQHTALHLQGAGDGGWSQRHDGNYLT